MPWRSLSSRTSANAFDVLFAHQLGDALDEARLVHLERNLGDDDALALALLGNFDFGAGTHHDGAAAGLVRLANAFTARNQTGGGKVRAGHELHQLSHGGLRRVNQVNGGVDDFAHVVGRNVGGHADRDAVRAVDQQVGKPRRHHQRLEVLPVVVGPEIDGVFV